MNRFHFASLLLLLAFLTACTKSLETLPAASEPADLDIVLKLSQTRAWDAAVDKLSPTLSTVSVSIIDANQQVLERKVFELSGEEELPLRFTIPNVQLKGTEWVELVANATDQDLDALSIESIQASSSQAGLSGAIYQGRAAIQANTPNHYKAAVSLEPIYSRVEISGQIKYDPFYIASLQVEVITPLSYRTTYGGSYVFQPKVSNPGPLWQNLTAEQYGWLANNEKVQAFHLFGGDPHGISIRLRGKGYTYVLDDDGNPLKKDYTPDEQNPTPYYVLKAVATTEADLPEDTDPDSIFLLYEVYEPHRKFVLFATSEQEENILPLDQANLKETIQPQFQDIGAEASNGFFNLVNYRTEASGTELVDQGRYQAGKIYQIDLGQIDWDGDGEFTDADQYNPNLHGLGHKEPSGGGGLQTNTKVKGWIVKEYRPHVQ